MAGDDAAARRRRSDGVLALLALAAAGFLATFLHAAVSGGGPPAAVKALAADLGLTDLALFTEARYTRHPSQADLHSAFQDHPLALDHFPSGSLLAPPPTLTGHAHLDRATALPD